MTTTAQTAPTTVPVADAARILTALDRCDQCGAQAWHRATLASTWRSLCFCAHHGKEHIDALLPQCSQWLDESRFLVAEPGAPA